MPPSCKSLDKTFGDQLFSEWNLTRIDQVDEAKKLALPSGQSHVRTCSLQSNGCLRLLHDGAGPQPRYFKLHPRSDVVKLFRFSGRPSYVKALRGPFPHIPLMPTGGSVLPMWCDWFKAGVLG